MPIHLSIGVLIATLLLGTNELQAQSQWGNEDTEALFPTFIDGWQHSALETEELKTITSDFEEIVGSVSGGDTGISIRLKLTRNYTSGEKLISLSIDSLDLRSAGMIVAIWDDSVSVQELAQKGITRRRVGTFKGLSVVQESKAGLIINVGLAGIVTFECAYVNCPKDIEDILSALDFTEIERFVEFDHRK